MTKAIQEKVILNEIKEISLNRIGGNIPKYFDLTYNELRYTPFSMEDKKYWQFYKQRKEELNPKKKNKK